MIYLSNEEVGSIDVCCFDRVDYLSIFSTNGTSGFVNLSAWLLGWRLTAILVAGRSGVI